jgi:hypothetical protein
MKYKDFLSTLVFKTANKAHVGPSISIDIMNAKIMVNKTINSTFKTTLRYIIFPIKIYGETLRHLNILILDKKTKIIERFEPFNQFFNYTQINDLLEPLLYRLMEHNKIYFLKYVVTLNTETILNDKNCGFYCIRYAIEKLKGHFFDFKFNGLINHKS